MIIPGKDVYGEKIQKEFESHETAHRGTGYNSYSKDYSEKSINNLDSGENEHLYIASKVNKDPEQLEYYRKKYFSMMPKKMFDIYYKVVEKYYDNKYAIESDPNYPTGKASGGEAKNFQASINLLNNPYKNFRLKKSTGGEIQSSIDLLQKRT